VAVPEHTFCILPLREVPDMGNREKKGEGPAEPDGRRSLLSPCPAKEIYGG